ncbi:hypothetical protein GDO81_007337 [Engystomops pustulosus]|uniref:Olfactory receptor n=1 Tax=Engystomops pustulosus TaxID=76066 RepID=A0AAV7C6N5_ENGPU|nr:hypothetical protein GDO81_007337 [Engystomops pustulosus]
MENLNQTVKVTEFIFLSFTKSTRLSVLLFIIFLLGYLLIICMNIVMILVIKFDTRVHTPMYFFIFNLCCLDICCTTSVIPQTLSNLMRSKPSILFLNCATQTFSSAGFSTAEIFVVTVMAYDRYMAICNPLRYETVMSWARCSMLVIVAWMLAFMIALTIVCCVYTLPFCRRPEIEHFFCDIGQVLFLTCTNVPSHMAAEFISYFLGLGLITIPFLIYLYILSVYNLSYNEDPYH